jgi:hypothetical protein
MSNFFGKTICIMFADTTVITHGYIELTLSNDNNIKLCNKFELCLISSVGYNLILKTKTGDISPDQQFKLEGLQYEVSGLIFTQVKQTL